MYEVAHTCFPLVTKLVTLNDLEARNGRYLALFRGTRPLPRTHPQKILATPMPYRNVLTYMYLLTRYNYTKPKIVTFSRNAAHSTVRHTRIQAVTHFLLVLYIRNRTKYTFQSLY